MIFKNLTDRSITVVGPDEKVILTLEASKSGAFCSVDTNTHEYMDKIPVVSYRYHKVVGLPPPEKEVVFIVKYAVLKALDNSRPDVVAPDTSPSSVVRDPLTGKVVGVRKFQKL